MKAILVVFTVAGGMLTLIILIDFIMGTDPSTLLWKALNPFRVMEAAEYIIIFLFALMFSLKLLQAFLKKRRQRNSEAN
ncbi:hypothetical protein [Bacillus sp. USDA818B3_A]|uniref:hypothetical protein n=1 Tax=Bacillus sp. USDA818B3_A TaxID=2698834 RepID=UPI00136B61B3|nr:hypothetical protein [Bacillus sp. USDA818B3_A]